MDLQNVRPGDPFQPKAETWNAMVDAARWTREQRGRAGGGFGPSARDPVVVTVVNGSGSALARFDAVSVTGVVTVPSEGDAAATSEFLSRVALKVERPAANDSGGWLVLLEPLEANAVGKALASGVCPVRLQVREGAENCRFADALEGTNALVATHAGAAEILWREEANGSSPGDGGSAEGPGEGWAVVRVGPPAMPACMLGVVVCKGPEDEPPPTGNRYWVQESGVTYSDGVSFEAIKDGRIVEATNLFEMPEMHHVGAGEPVMVFSGWDADGELRYWMIAAREGGLPCGSSSGSQSGSSSGSRSSDSGSGSGSGSGGSGSGDSGGGSGSSNGSDKSTAIVPAAFAPTGYAALFTLEAPEVRFDDVIGVTIPQRNQRLPIDPRYLAVCEPGSVRVCGVVCDQPVAIGAAVVGGEVQLRFRRPARRELSVVIRLTGIRRGFAGLRFPARRRDQFLSNERFINSAYPR